MVANSPIGTETKKMSRQLMGARTPPSTRPMNVPLMAAVWLMPRAIPRWSFGKASVRMAADWAKSIAAPTPWKTRITISQIPAAGPDIQVIESRREKKVKMANPAL